MNAIATTGLEEMLSLKATETCKVVVLYEDALAHRRAMEIGHQLAAQFGHEPEFAFDAWEIRALAEPASARLACQATAQADIVLFSTHGDDLSLAIRAWLESWVEIRAKMEGILALVVTVPVSATAAIPALVPRLQQAALRLRMRFLSYMPGQTEGRAGEADRRANEVAGLAGETVEQPHWLHWGLNE
jgi:hypothetical protein